AFTINGHQCEAGKCRCRLASAGVAHHDYIAHDGERIFAGGPDDRPAIRQGVQQHVASATRVTALAETGRQQDRLQSRVPWLPRGARGGGGAKSEVAVHVAVVHDERSAGQTAKRKKSIARLYWTPCGVFLPSRHGGGQPLSPFRRKTVTPLKAWLPTLSCVSTSSRALTRCGRCRKINEYQSSPNDRPDGRLACLPDAAGLGQYRQG